MVFDKKNISIHYLILLVFIGGLMHLNYYTDRTDFIELILQIGLLFGLVFYWNKKSISLKEILFFGIVARLVLLGGAPQLSNDYFRFIWDGELLTKGINPYLFKPNELISNSMFIGNEYFRDLFHGMGDLSASNYSCYPVLNQGLFYIGALFTDSISVNLIILKIIIILADIGIFYIGIKILSFFQLNQNRIIWYFLNPYIILEFTMNLHFEGVMIFFIFCTLLAVLKKQLVFGSLFLSLAIHIKIIPFLFIPFFYKYLKIKKSLVFTILTLGFVFLIAQLLINQYNYSNFLESLNLYFSNFQFNASIFNWSNTVYSKIIGWDTTYIVGPLLSKVGLVLIILFGLTKANLKKVDFIIAMMFALVIYYAFATTVHPWYISVILSLSLFTNYKFPIIWSAFIFLSYYAYGTSNFDENILLNTLVYILIYGVMLYEIKKNTNRLNIGLQLKSFFKWNPTKD